MEEEAWLMESRAFMTSDCWLYFRDTSYSCYCARIYAASIIASLHFIPYQSKLVVKCPQPTIQLVTDTYYMHREPSQQTRQVRPRRCMYCGRTVPNQKFKEHVGRCMEMLHPTPKQQNNKTTPKIRISQRRISQVGDGKREDKKKITGNRFRIMRTQLPKKPFVVESPLPQKKEAQDVALKVEYREPVFEYEKKEEDNQQNQMKQERMSVLSIDPNPEVQSRSESRLNQQVQGRQIPIEVAQIHPAEEERPSELVIQSRIPSPRPSSRSRPASPVINPLEPIDLSPSPASLAPLIPPQQPGPEPSRVAPSPLVPTSPTLTPLQNVQRLVSNSESLILFLQSLNSPSDPVVATMINQLTQLNAIARQLTDITRLGRAISLNMNSIFMDRIQQLYIVIINQVAVQLGRRFQGQLNSSLFSSLAQRQPELKIGFTPSQIDRFFECKVNSSVKQCAICLEDMGVGERMLELQCRHVFHPQCIKEWLTTSKKCPMCRHLQEPPQGHA